MKWVNTEDGFWVTGALRDDGARRGRVLEPLWLNGYHIIARVQSKLQRPLCCFNDGALITNYTAQQCPSPHSSALTFINILLVSLGARHFTPPAPKEKSAVVVIQEFNFHCNETRFVLGSDTSGKTNIGGSLSPRLPWLQSHSLMIGFILVLSLATSPGSQRQRDVDDSDVSPYRLHAATSKLRRRHQKKKTGTQTLSSFWSSRSDSREGRLSLSLCLQPAALGACKKKKSTSKKRNTERPRRRANGVNVSLPDEGSPQSSSAGSRPVAPLSPHQWPRLARRQRYNPSLP